jgi:hypothetical protein
MHFPWSVTVLPLPGSCYNFCFPSFSAASITLLHCPFFYYYSDIILPFYSLHSRQKERTKQTLERTKEELRKSMLQPGEDKDTVVQSQPEPSVFFDQRLSSCWKRWIRVHHQVTLGVAGSRALGKQTAILRPQSLQQFPRRSVWVSSIFVPVWQLLSCPRGVPSLTRGWVCILSVTWKDITCRVYIPDIWGAREEGDSGFR